LKNLIFKILRVELFETKIRLLLKNKENNFHPLEWRKLKTRKSFIDTFHTDTDVFKLNFWVKIALYYIVGDHSGVPNHH
jgi:hypothetical protein